MIGFPSFSQPYMYIQPYYIQQPLQSPPKILSSTSANFHLPIPPLLFNKITLTIPTNTHFLYAAAIFNLPVFAYNHASYLHQKIFSLPHPFSQFRLHRRTKGLRSFNLSRLPQSMDSDIRVHNHWFLIYSGLENWCIAGSSVSWRCLQLEWQIIPFTFSHTLNI